MGTCVQPYHSLFLIFLSSLIGMILFIEILSFCDWSSGSFIQYSKRFMKHQLNMKLMKLLSGRIMHGLQGNEWILEEHRKPGGT